MMNTTLIRGVRVFDTLSGSFRWEAVRIQGDTILAVAPDLIPKDGENTLDGMGRCLCPGLVDVHTHGRIGYDFDSATVEEMQKMRLSYRLDGTTTVLPTIASAPLDQMMQAVKRVRECGFLGVHLEGRYLNPKRRGAHRLDLLSAPNAEELNAFSALCDGMALHITMAPEMENGAAFVKQAIRLGATVSMGHSDATLEEANEAFAWGITGVSHLCNAMAPIHHRMPGNITAALLSDVSTEVICDGMHVHPAMVRLICKCKADDKMVLITDSMSATKCPDGNYAIAGQPVIVKDGKALNEEGALAGSTITLLDGLWNLMDFCHYSLQEALPFATINPAKMTGIDDTVGSIAPAKRADFILLDENTKELLGVVAGGDILDWKL